MLRHIGTNDKTFEERLEEAIGQIPIYSSEWSNHNQSDPGITILENFSLFETLQQQHIAEIPPTVKAALLKMAGFVPQKGRPARVLLGSEGLKSPAVINKGQRFYVGDMFFEAARKQVVCDDTLIALAGCRDNDFVDYSELLDAQLMLRTKIFRDLPQPGDQFFLIFSSLPDSGSEFYLYAECEEVKGRCPFDEKERDMFSSLTWEVYTEDGFVAANVRDMTGGFVTSGEIRVRIPESSPAVYDGCHEALKELPGGYCIRVTIDRCGYDVAPVLRTVKTGLFEVTQMDTSGFLISGNKATEIELFTRPGEERYVSVFAREQKGGSYRRYEPSDGDSALAEKKGRYYDEQQLPDGVTRIIFDKEKYGFGPEKGRGAVRIMGYSEKIMRQYRLGTVIGYDNEVFDLPEKAIIPDSFSVMAMRYDKNHVPYYDFVRPEHSEDGALFYHLLEREGKIIIENAGDFIGSTLYIGGVSVYRGEAGNIRAGVVFKAQGNFKGVLFKNPGPGRKGRYPESLSQLSLRYKRDIDEPFAAVTRSDYERLVLSTPGLCISKVRAYTDAAKNRVSVAVLPAYADKDKLPVLSADYEKRIMERLEQRRLLSTRVIISKPRYIKVNSKATIYVKQHFDGAREQIEKALSACLDYVKSDASFGEPLKFDRVFRTIEALPCVDYIYSLSMRPENQMYATLEDLDIRPADNGLLIPGSMNIEIITSHR